jgi:hypothetical protein
MVKYGKIESNREKQEMVKLVKYMVRLVKYGETWLNRGKNEKSQNSMNCANPLRTKNSEIL